MLKDFEVANVKLSTASCVLHQMEDCVYDPKAISNIISKPQKIWRSDKGINTQAVSAHVSFDYLTVSPDTSCIFLLDPDSPLTDGAKKGRPTKSSPMRVVTKDFNSQVVETEMAQEMSAEQYTIAQRKVSYLPESDCILLYAAWITNNERQNTILLLELLDVNTTGGTTIEDGMLMIMAGLDTMRMNFPSIRAFLPSECQWVFHFSFSYVFPKLLGVGTISPTRTAPGCSRSP
jgi:hypothetical protein